MIALFKQATGLSDREIAALLGCGRSTAQTYAAGTLTPTLTASAAQRILTVIAERQALLDAIKQRCQPDGTNHEDTA